MTRKPDIQAGERTLCPSCGHDQDGAEPTHCLSCGWPLYGAKKQRRYEYAPAPWRVDAETPNHAPIITAQDGKGRDIAEIRGDTKVERAATARLMAAAPGLFAFVKDYVEQCDCGDGGDHDASEATESCWHCWARALVAKVEGKA